MGNKIVLWAVVVMGFGLAATVNVVKMKNGVTANAIRYEEGPRGVQVHIGWFGGKPNDGKDDGPALAAALRALDARGGGTVFLGRGIYNFRDDYETPVVKNPTTVNGCNHGWGMTSNDGAGPVYRIVESTETQAARR